MATDDDVDAIAAGIERRGGTLESPPEDTPWGARAFSLVDPDGFKITISSNKSSRRLNAPTDAPRTIRPELQRPAPGPPHFENRDPRPR
ncbi:MAG: VOC family protein [Gemmatimonadetes bacterium]|nr:VOC family protein [Gemmatimonadota bacterium]